MLLVMALLAKGVISWGQMGWRAGVHPVDLGRVPIKIETWHAKQVTMDNASRKLLTPDAYLWRNYISPKEPPVNLFVVYGHSKNTFHSPGFCLPGGGWQVASKRDIVFDYGTGQLPMNLFQIQKDGIRQLVLFSFVAGEASTSSLYRHNWNLLVDRVFHRTNGGALLRLVIPMEGSEKQALEKAARFARDALPPIRDELAGKKES
jgi:EpsI family protein